MLREALSVGIHLGETCTLGAAARTCHSRCILDVSRGRQCDGTDCGCTLHSGPANGILSKARRIMPAIWLNHTAAKSLLSRLLTARVRVPMQTGLLRRRNGSMPIK
jgi:hypothetical protein